MEPEVFFRAVLEAWSELPTLLGPAWSEVMLRLQALVEQCAASRDPAERRALLVELILLFRSYEPARARLQRTLQSMGDVRGSLRRGRSAELALTREEEAAELMTKLRQRLNPRYVNVSFARHGTPSAVAKTSSLAAAAEYDLRIDIGPLSADSIVANAATQPFPSERLPSTEVGYWLEVVAVSDKFAVPERAYPMFLPRLGPSWVCDCVPGASISALRTCAENTS
jgi:hypothetical protein